jgi:NAD(P)-dependent dehydrogenase (short-subunit alcohol dehydrogenase family)
VRCEKVAEVQTFVADAVKQLGSIDILVNNAGRRVDASPLLVTDPKNRG